MQLSVDSGRTRAESRPRYSSASRRIVLLTLVRVGDVAIVSLVGLIVTFARFWADDAPPVLGTSLVIGGLIAANVFPLFRVYEPRRLAQLNHQIPRVLAAWLVSLGVLLVVLYAFRVGQELSRLWVGYWLLCGWGALITSRLLLKAALDRPELRHLGHRAAVVGEAGAVDACLEHLGSEPAALGVVLVMRLEPGRPIPAGELDRLEERLTAREVDQVVLASADVAGVIEPALRRLRQVAVEVAWAPQASCPGVPMLGFTALGDQPLVRVLERPIDGWHYLIKEALDRSVALLALAFLAPLLLLVAVAVRLDSPGPALYRQTRRGLNREPIDVYKFRTMYAHPATRPTRRCAAGGAARPAHHAARPLPAPHQPRRAAAADQRAARRDEPGRPAPARRRARHVLCQADRRLSRSPPRQARHHRLGAGQRPARRDRHPGQDARPGRARPLLRRQLVAAARPPDPAADPSHRGRPARSPMSRPRSGRPTMRVALVHDYLTQYGGAERVLDEFKLAFPDAPVFTSVVDLDRMPARYRDWDIRASWLQRIPRLLRRDPRLLLPLLPAALELFDFDGFDVVLASSSGFCHGTLTGAQTCKLTYCHSPPRFVWDTRPTRAARACPRACGPWCNRCCAACASGTWSAPAARTTGSRPADWSSDASPSATGARAWSCRRPWTPRASSPRRGVTTATTSCSCGSSAGSGPTSS